MGAESPRLYVKGRVLGYKRSRNVQYPSQTRLTIEGVKDRKDVQFYLGKRVAYVYKGEKAKHNNFGRVTKVRVMWGKITAPHGNNGCVKAKFKKNLPSTSFGKACRIMLYPSKI